MDATPKARAPRRSPYTWPTWISGLLAGDASCWYAAWFKSHFTWQKVERGRDFDLTKWKVEHTQMVDARVSKLKAEGWTVTVEDQNGFSLKGKRGTLGGKPDIVAIKDADALIVDCKGGARKGADVQQVLIYMYAVPIADKRVFGKTVSGEVQYRDGSIPITPEQFTPELRKGIVQAMVDVSGDIALSTVPSARECAWCEIGKWDCPQRVETAPAEVAVSEF